MIKEKIAETLQQALSKAVNKRMLGSLAELTPEIIGKINIERTKNPEFGDYACNISFLARDAKMPPPKIAGVIAGYIDPKTQDIFTTSIAAGFINFKLTPTLLNTTLTEIISNKENYGRTNKGNKLKVNLEYVSANPTGPLHIGHGRWAALGSSIHNILSFAGYDVDAEFYINDAGVQIKNLGHSLFLRILQQFDPSTYFPSDKEKDSRTANFYPGKYLVDIAEQFIEKHPDIAKSLKNNAEIQDNLYIPDINTIKILSDFAKAIILEEQKQLLKAFKTEFKTWYPETTLHQSGKVANILGFLGKSGYMYEKDGATWFASSRLHDEYDRVVKKSDDTLTYLTADIAYHKDKYDRGYEHLINIWGADHHGYVPRMKSAVEALGKSADSLEVIIGQMVNLIIDGEQQRMGKRKKMVTLGELIDEVGVDATRYWMVLRSTDTTLDFDINLAKSASDENPVYYVQYAHARCCSILRTATSERLDTENNTALPALYTESALLSVISNIENKPELLTCLCDNIDDKQILATKTLILYLESFKDTVIKAARDRAPHYISRYLIDLASCFHSFYAECRVLNLKTNGELPQELQNARLALIIATRQILLNGLTLLGVSAPESM